MRVHAVDLFAGAGGTSTGLALACKALGKDVDLTAINHWETAIDTHSKNHPWAKHLCQSVESVDPREVVPGLHLHILVASPECTHHSRAAGGRPKNDQKRASSWSILRWLELLKVDSLLVENVQEFEDWGPLLNGHPIKARKGETYQSWISAIRSFGYNVDTRILNAADYGAPTSRSRLFVQARKGNMPICWPVATHSKGGRGRNKWKPARGIIDWSIQGQSIFGRKRPLKPNTIRRIIEGLKRFGGPDVQPFIVLMEHGGGVKDLSDPLPTITTARGGAMGLVQPKAFILSQGNGGAPKSVDDDPVPTIVTKGAHSFIVPFFGERGSQKPRAHSVDDPLPAVTSHGAGGVAKAFIVEYHAGKGKDSSKRVSSVDDPLKTVDTANRFGIARPFILPVRGFFGGNTAKSVDEPLGTITQRGYGGVVDYLVQYNGNSEAQSVDDPLGTVTTRERFALVQPEINGRYLDIRFRMLQPHELAMAMGFPKSYEFTGKKVDVVKQIGNAVVVQVAKALCTSLLTRRTKGILG